MTVGGRRVPFHEFFGDPGIESLYSLQQRIASVLVTTYGGHLHIKQLEVKKSMKELSKERFDDLDLQLHYIISTSHILLVKNQSLAQPN